MKGTLQELKRGETAVVLKVDESLSCRRRLEELGFLPGETVRCALTSPLGWPHAYHVMGGVVALRESEAEGIFHTKIG